MFLTNAYFPDFEDVRRRRSEFYAGRQPRRRSRAVVTMVRDEREFLPIWLEYYSRHFDAEDIYVLDHLTGDGSTRRTGFNRVPVVHELVEQAWFNEVITDMQHRLLRWYDLVLICDVDEIVAPHPAWGTLGAYLDRFDEEFVNCVGHEVVHVPQHEPALDLGQRILGQRRRWFRSPLYDKPLLATVPMEWGLGFHRRADGLTSYDPDLYLIHLHRMDYGLCLARHVRRRNMAWSEESLRDGMGGQNRIADEAEFPQWFFADTGIPQTPLDLLDIDPVWATIV